MNQREPTMKILSPRIFLAGLLVLGLIATLLMQPAQSFPNAQQSTPQSSNIFVPPFAGVWVGTYQFVGGGGQLQLYINPSGDLFGSLASDDGLHFAQISGKHRNYAFHIVFTPPSGISAQSGDSGVDASAKWQGNPERFTVSSEAVGHPYTYSFKRLKQK